MKAKDGNALNQALKDERADLGPKWLTHEDAARALGVGIKYLSDRLRIFLTHKSGSLRARSARNVGYVYLRSDIQCTNAIKQTLGVETRRACETLSAIRQLRRRGLLDAIEKQLDLALEETAND